MAHSLSRIQKRVPIFSSLLSSCNSILGYFLGVLLEQKTPLYTGASIIKKSEVVKQRALFQPPQREPTCRTV